jgi:pimeloyl-ACP methyl ester carboxylesterase
MTTPRRSMLEAVLALAVAVATPAGAQVAGLQPEVVFTEATPLSSNAELARRLLTPLTAAQTQGLLARAGKRLAEQPIDPAAERFVVYVPAQRPPNGYGLLVFVPPWPEAKLPEGWAAVLDRQGLIYASAARSGNDASVLGRREPLALIAAANIIARYPVDASRVYVGGFSGGARVAMRLALGYPDVFRGALLGAGSDPIGDAEIPLPPRDLFLKFQSDSRLVYLTGGEDTERLGMAAVSARSMHDWCVFDIEQQVIRGAAHELAPPEPLSRALTALQAHASADPAKLAACRAGLQREMDAKLDRAQTLLATGHRDEARRLLTKIDQRFGGLAAPRSLDLATK